MALRDDLPGGYGGVVEREYAAAGQGVHAHIYQGIAVNVAEMAGEVGTGEIDHEIFRAILGEIGHDRRVGDVGHGDGEGLQGKSPGRVFYPQRNFHRSHVILAGRAAE